MIRPLLFSVLLLFPFFVAAQDKNDHYLNEWRKADSLLQQGLPESAVKIIQSVYSKAKANNQQVQMMKAQLYLLSADFQKNEEAFQHAIKVAEENIATASFPDNVIWQSLAAELYWKYYQQNRWKILDRKQVDSKTNIADFEQWDANRFFEKISTLYLASIVRADDLQKITIERYDPILIKGENTRNLRPTLFDLLAFRALEYFQNEEKDITKPSFAFIMNEAKAFDPIREFIATSFKTQDTVSLHWHALKLYQKTLSIHTDDAHKDALIDADLHRLVFVYNNSVHPEKKELYKKALLQIEEGYPGNPLSALASYRVAELMMPEYRIYEGAAKGQADYPIIVKRLEKIITRFPESEGGVLAKNMLSQIQSKELNITSEEVVLPGEPSKVLISYRNISKAWLRIVQLDNSDKYFDNRYGNINELYEYAQSLTYLKQWNINLPATSDYEKHRTEVKIDALSTGFYAIIISSREDFSKDDNILSYTPFQVSRISAVSSSNVGFALDRKTGKPLQNANVDFYRQRYNNNIHGYDYIKTSTTSTDKDGKFKYSKESEYSNAIRIRYEKDTLMLSGYFSGRDKYREDRPQVQTFFFTDRAIYRPGQTIFFKGIMVRKEDGGKKNNVVANEATEVIFYDVNGQKIDTRKFTTNNFGSFSGSFTAPEGLLNGNMRIANSSGGTDFSVEEYKRPKFVVSFDTLKNSYALNETITVRGEAVAYAGNAIDNATVQYRIVRNARYPFWWYAYRWGFPPSPEMEIANGTAKTDSKGNFSIDFKAIPDPSVNPESLPVFTYTISADVTDVNGETRSGNATVNVGYTALQLSINAPEKATPEDLDSIGIRSFNLNDRFVATDISLRISKLKTPDQILRKRLWDMPDQFVMDSLEFKQYFPNDIYRDEGNHLNWAIDRNLLDRKIITTQNGLVAIPMSTWNKNGWYVIEVSTKDKTGKELTEKKYVQVWSEKNTGKTTEALVAVPSTQPVEPGSKATVIVSSGYDQLYLLREVIDQSDKPEYAQETFNGNYLTWNRNVSETDRGGILVSYITVKENRVYQQQAFVQVPWSNTELNISWETHRDKLLPGSKEAWTMVIKGNKKEAIAAEMVATLYDASLDAFRTHNWSIYGLFPSLTTYSRWNGVGFGQNSGRMIAIIPPIHTGNLVKIYDALIHLRYEPGYNILHKYRNGAAVRIQEYKVPLANKDDAKTYTSEQSQKLSAEITSDVAASASNQKGTLTEEPDSKKSGKYNELIQPRKNLQETAFFLPGLRTDNEGNVHIEFTIPEALTEWKLMGFAHTKDMSYGKIEGSVRTQKELMVMPNLPRFFRQGDDIIITAKISNLSNNALTGNATIEIRKATMMSPADLPFRLEQKDQKFSVAPGQSTTATWQLHVPESLYEPVNIRILAQAGNFTDGEENAIPVISNRMMVTETLPLWINGNGTKNFSFDKLKHADTSKTLTHHALTLEYTSNPAWYAVQSLPYLMEYPYECAEQTFNRYYATALAAHIVQQSPKIKAIFEKWKMEALLSSFSSPLERNQELKSALLEETPWVMEAQTETERRKRLGQLFDTYNLAKELDATMRQLKEMQLPEGGFPWFKGMRPDQFVTQYIITGLGRLQQLRINDTKGNMQDIISKALPYLDQQMYESYELLIRNKAKLDAQHISYTEVQYLYMRSFFKKSFKETYSKAYNYYRTQASKYWPKFNPYMKGMIAIALARANDKQTPQTIVQSLKETAIYKEEMGMYWMQRGNSYWWYDAPIEAQSLLIECFNEVAADHQSIDAMKIWLLKNKQTQNWETTKATADACYALLLSGTDWLQQEPKVSIKLGEQSVNNTNQAQEAGSGYFKVHIEGNRVKPTNGNVQLTVTENTNSTSWGAVYWQYFEELDKISSAATPLVISKQLFIECNTARGPQLYPITEKDQLHIGDKLTIRIELMVDRDMEYVHMKDMRAAAFEPVNVISGYKWQGGLGYYESTKDISTSFFFDHLRKGRYVFEYPVFVQQAGSFSNGIATIQCMYAPEFSSHSEGIRVKVVSK